MQRLKTNDPTVYRFTALNMDHLDAMLKLVDKTRGDLPEAEVARLRESMRRLREDIASSVEKPGPG